MEKEALKQYLESNPVKGLSFIEELDLSYKGRNIETVLYKYNSYTYRLSDNEIYSQNGWEKYLTIFQANSWLEKYNNSHDKSEEYGFVTEITYTLLKATIVGIKYYEEGEYEEYREGVEVQISLENGEKASIYVTDMNEIL